MWATLDVSPPRPGIPVIPKPVKTPRRPPSLAVSAAKSWPPAANNDVGGLGRTTLTALESRPSPKPKPPTNSIPIPEKEKSRQEEEEEEKKKQISGSDVLWALQKAAAKKNKASGNKNKNNNKNKKKKSGAVGLSSKAGRGEEAAGDYYDNVRPLRVKIEWSAKLDDLENRLRELSHSK